MLTTWLSYIEGKIGFVLPKSQHQWLMNAVITTARQHNLPVEELYCRIQHDYELQVQLFNAVLINESRFFRHLDSLDFVAQLMHCHVAKGAFRIWSVGCATGQEAWSLAMRLQAEQEICDCAFQIVGSDISSRALDIAQRGIYSSIQIENIPLAYRGQIKSVDASWYRIDDRLRNQVYFIQHNLVAREAIPFGKQDVIFCQNVLIYFRRFDQRDILTRLADQLYVGGHLVLAPNEGLFWQHPNMQRISHDKVNVWRKIA